MTNRLYHHRGMMKDRDAKKQLQQRQKKRDEIWVKELCMELGVDPKEVLDDVGTANHLSAGIPARAN
ncbi:hypothetical protein [Aeromonas hydrophila]|uniref:hypothetical protein n=1 Tax=Aeromonas hydrophila TaxID=644 RepID=UPI002B46A395|nr:hypothetical protein [Aeromonas hydrophila]